MSKHRAVIMQLLTQMLRTCARYKFDNPDAPAATVDRHQHFLDVYRRPLEIIMDHGPDAKYGPVERKIKEDLADLEKQLRRLPESDLTRNQTQAIFVMREILVAFPPESDQV